MPRFHIKLQEIHEITVLVDAKDKEEAIDIVASGEGLTLQDETVENQNWDTNNWEVKEVSDGKSA